MKINSDNSIVYPVFNSITAGEVFKSGQSYYMAIEAKPDCLYNAVNLENGKLQRFFPDEEIQPYKNAELNLEN